MGCFGGGSQQSTTTTERAPTAEETELNKLQLEMQKATAPYQQQTQITGLQLANQLLSGQEPLPGYLNQLSQGISPEVTQSIVDQSLRDIKPSFQSGGILDSGVAAEISARTAADIRRASEEYNIGNRLNLLNLALSGQAQVQSPVLATSASLRSSLGTLGKTTSDTYQRDNNTFGRMFMQSIASTPGQFAQGTGQAAGTAAFGGCWVAKEIYGSWEDDRTHMARFYILNIAPSWFRELYLGFGERFARFISNKKIIKAMLKPLFDMFGRIAEKEILEFSLKVRMA